MDFCEPLQAHPMKSIALAILSLVCGILGILSLGTFLEYRVSVDAYPGCEFVLLMSAFLLPIVAVACGHLARAEIRKSSALLAARMIAAAGTIMGYLLFTMFIAGSVWPHFLAAKPPGPIVRQISGARNLCLAFFNAVEAVSDKPGDEKCGYPADIGARTSQEVIGRLVAGGYLDEWDKKRWLHYKFEIGNVSDKDPDDTIIIRFKPANSQERVVIAMKGGEVLALSPDKVRSTGKLPPRDPPFLP